MNRTGVLANVRALERLPERASAEAIARTVQASARRSVCVGGPQMRSAHHLGQRLNLCTGGYQFVRTWAPRPGGRRVGGGHQDAECCRRVADRAAVVGRGSPPGAGAARPGGFNRDAIGWGYTLSDLHQAARDGTSEVGGGTCASGLFGPRAGPRLTRGRADLLGSSKPACSAGQLDCKRGGRKRGDEHRQVIDCHVYAYFPNVLISSARNMSCAIGRT
jgi:hypothetical protein